MLQHLSALVSSLAHAHLLPEIPELGQPRGAELTDRLSPIAPEAHSNLLISRLQQARGELQKPSNESGIVLRLLRGPEYGHELRGRQATFGDGRPSRHAYVSEPWPASLNAREPKLRLLPKQRQRSSN